MPRGEDTRHHPNRRPIIPMRGKDSTGSDMGKAMAQGLQSAVNYHGNIGVDPASGLADSSHVVEGIGNALDRAGFTRIFTNG